VYIYIYIFIDLLIIGESLFSCGVVGGSVDGLVIKGKGKVFPLQALGDPVG
jgi:hypothetical protein